MVWFYVPHQGITIKLAFEKFRISETCYLYELGMSSENELIAHWLLHKLQSINDEDYISTNP